MSVCRNSILSKTVCFSRALSSIFGLRVRVPSKYLPEEENATGGNLGRTMGIDSCVQAPPSNPGFSTLADTAEWHRLLRPQASDITQHSPQKAHIRLPAAFVAPSCSSCALEDEGFVSLREFDKLPHKLCLQPADSPIRAIWGSLPGRRAAAGYRYKSICCTASCDPALNLTVGTPRLKELLEVTGISRTSSRWPRHRCTGSFSSQSRYPW